MALTDKELARQAKQYLSQIRKKERLAARIGQTIFLLRSNLISQNYALNPNKVQTSPDNDQMSRTIAKAIDLEAEMQTQIEELVSARLKAVQLIDRVIDPDRKNVLIARYLQGEKWEKIAEAMNYSLRYIYKIHGKALVEFGRALQN